MVDCVGDWKKGPLPPDTWNYGGIVVDGVPEGYMMLASFSGDCALVNDHVYTADEILWYNNNLQLPPLELWGKKEQERKDVAVS